MLRSIMTGLILLLLSGCAALPSFSNPKEQGPWPATRGIARLNALCEASIQRGRISAREWADGLLTALETVPPHLAPAVIQALQLEVGCILMTSTEGKDPVVLTSSMGEHSAILWWENGRWQRALTVDLAWEPEVLYDFAGPYGRELFIAARHTGTAQSGKVVVLRRAGLGWKAILNTEAYGHFQPGVISADYILVTSTSGYGQPLAWAANCCVPSSYQRLWKREGKGFALAGERQAPDPYFTMNVFFGALRERDQEWLGRVGTPQAIAAARRMGLGDARVDFPSSLPLELGRIQEVEARHWPALLGKVNGQPPAIREVKVQLIEQTERGETERRVTATLRRIGDWWFVVNLEPL
jgi:hypothetical protein